MLMNWLNPGDLLLVLIAGGIGYLTSTLQTWNLHRRTYSLECAVADLEEKVLHEVKKRAGQERQKDTKIEAEILAAAKLKPAQPELPWWVKVKGAG
jgi:hypothetical protein